MSEWTPNPVYTKPSPPRPIEEQAWRRHHTGRTALGVGFYDADWSDTSGCQRRRSKAIKRREWIHELMLKHQYKQRVMLGVDA